jgi:hypothetical protein
VKKRAEPDRASPIRHGGVVYDIAQDQAATWGSDPLPGTATVSLVAMDEGDGRELWRTRLYDVHFDGEMERDKQEIYVTSLAFNLFRTKVKAVDEKGRRYAIDLKSHQVTAG